MPCKHKAQGLALSYVGRGNDTKPVLKRLRQENIPYEASLDYLNDTPSQNKRRKAAQSARAATAWVSGLFNTLPGFLETSK